MHVVQRHFASLLIGVGAGGAATYYFLTNKGVKRGSEGVSVHRALKYGSPSLPCVREFSSFVVEYDPRLRNPRWVLEHISKDTQHGPGTRDVAMFYEDEAIEERFRSRLSDYRGSGYDRGHMAPAANHKSSQEAMRDTFVLTNIAPQVGAGFNRDYWARFERFVKQLLGSCSDLYIITGTLYLPTKTPQGYVLRHPMLGEPPRMVGVPTHFFKVVLAEQASSLPQFLGRPQRVVGAWVMPNSAIDPNTPLTAFAVPLAALEEVSGLRFFPKFLTDARRTALDESALAWQALGRTECQALKGGRAAVPSLLETTKEPPLLLPPPSSSSPPTQVDSTARTLRRSQTTPADNERGPTGRSAGLHHSESSPNLASVDAGSEILPETLSPSERKPSRKEQKRRKGEEGVNGGWLPQIRTGAAGEGAIHVCEHTECRLPAADWYLASKQKASAENAGKAARLSEAGFKPKAPTGAPSDRPS